MRNLKLWQICNFLRWDMKHVLQNWNRSKCVSNQFCHTHLSVFLLAPSTVITHVNIQAYPHTLTIWKTTKPSRKIFISATKLFINASHGAVVLHSKLCFWSLIDRFSSWCQAVYQVHRKPWKVLMIVQSHGFCLNIVGKTWHNFILKQMRNKPIYTI